MDELIKKIERINNISELENIKNINTNEILYAIIKCQRYHLLNNSDLHIDINDTETLEQLAILLLSNEDNVYFLEQNNFSISLEEINAIFAVISKKYADSKQFRNFIYLIESNKESLKDFVINNESFFIEYIKNTDVIPFSLYKCESFINLLIKEKRLYEIKNLEFYSVSNLKSLVNIIQDIIKLNYYSGNNKFAEHLFDVKQSLEPFEFCELLNLFTYKDKYDIELRNSNTTSFENLVANNVEYLIDVVSKTGTIPKCLLISETFRDECIKRGRIDLAVNCLLPQNIIEKNDLMQSYSEQLNISYNELQNRITYILEYSKKNNNIFNTILTSSIKTNIFNIKEEHYERFINDVDIQIAISKLNNKEQILLHHILNIYEYDSYDITSMVTNIIDNMKAYNKLIDSLNLGDESNYDSLLDELSVDDLTISDLKAIVCVLQIPNNPYQINSIEELHKYNIIKNDTFEKNYSKSDLETNKDNLLKVLFNIDLLEAKYIHEKYCQDNDNNIVLDKLKDSELPKEIYNYLYIINKIIECNNTSELFEMYCENEDRVIYSSEIPLEAYLRSVYTELYSKSLYKIKNIEEKKNEDNTSSVNYNNTEVQISIPRDNFNFFVHCVGSCSNASDISDSNYRNDWMDRPLIQDHFVACSYINEKGITAIRSERSIIYGFDSLEKGSILGMGNSDIDSIGPYSKAYAGSRKLQEGNGRRARFFIPSEILKTIYNGYNEIVIERRNNNKSNNPEFKRKPDYIIMMADSLENNNYSQFETLFKNQLNFINKEDQKSIIQLENPSQIKNYLKKYIDTIRAQANTQGIALNDLANLYVKLIMNAKYYEDCLKAASEFNIPLVIVDKEYYFRKMISDSNIYDKNTIENLYHTYSTANSREKSDIYRKIAKEIITKDYNSKSQDLNSTYKSLT